jgi:hypothetical protein
MFKCVYKLYTHSFLEMGNRSSVPEAAVSLQPVKLLKAAKKRGRTFPVENPSVIQMAEQIDKYRKDHPYGRCTICDSTSHNTPDHWNVMKKQDYEVNPASHFVCEQNLTHNPILFDPKLFDEAWQMIVDCLNEAALQTKYLFAEISRIKNEKGEEGLVEYVLGSDGRPRLTRETWSEQWQRQGGVCCPDEIKEIAREMANDFIHHGVITEVGHRRADLKFMYFSICYAVIRVFLDQLELQDAYLLNLFKTCLRNTDVLSAVPDGQAIVIAMLTNKPICREGLKLGKYLSRLVNAVWDEPEPDVGQKRKRNGGRTKGAKAFKRGRRTARQRRG